MSAAAAFAFISNPNSLNLSLTHLFRRNTSVFVFNSIPISLNSSLTKPTSLTQLLFRVPYGSFKRSSNYTSSRTFFSPVMEWQDCTVKTEIDVPISVAYNAYADREAIPRWMPFISSVKILEDKPDLSQWTLKYKAFGRDIEFSWLARNLQPIPNQKFTGDLWKVFLIGNQNKSVLEKARFARGAVRFFPKGPTSCVVELTVSYEVPQILVPVASALQPFLENLLSRGLERFANFAKTY